VDVGTPPDPHFAQSDTYVLKPRGLDPSRSYQVIFKSLNTTATVDGLRLMQEGIAVRLANIGMSELLMFATV